DVRAADRSRVRPRKDPAELIMTGRSTGSCLSLAIGVTAASGLCCGRAPATDASASAQPWFEEVADRSGIRFVHQSGHRDKFYLPEIMGGGAALFDMDNDGFLDLYLVQSGNVFAPGEKQPGNRLYRNRGDGTFEDVTAGS